MEKIIYSQNGPDDQDAEIVCMESNECKGTKHDGECALFEDYSHANIEDYGL